MFNPFIKKKQEFRELTATTVESSLFGATTRPAMRIPSVYKAVNTICSSVASVTIEDAPDALNREPQENITRYNWFNTQIKNLLLEGNSYAQIKGNELVILDPRNVSAMYDSNSQKILYYRHMTSIIYPENILHFKGLGADNLAHFGYSVLNNFSDTFSNIIDMKDYEASYLNNSAKPSLWISLAKKLSVDAVTDLKASFKAQYQGLKNSGNVPVMADGMEIKEIKQVNTLLDADLVNLKGASLKDVANIFNMPVSLLDDSLSTYGNAVEANLSYLKLCINPILTNIKEEINLKLNSKMFFDTSSLIEGSFEQKINTLNSAVSGGILTANEARARLNYEELKDGNRLYIPAGTPSTEKAPGTETNTDDKAK